MPKILIFWYGGRCSRYILISVDFLGLGRFVRVYWIKIVVLGFIVLSLLAALHDLQTTLNLARQLAQLGTSLASVTLLAGMKVSKSNSARNKI